MANRKREETRKLVRALRSAKYTYEKIANVLGVNSRGKKYTRQAVQYYMQDLSTSKLDIK